MPRVLLALIGLLVLAVSLLTAQGGVGPIGTLQGKVDSNNSLVIAPAAAGTIPTSPQGVNTIANLRGKVDSLNQLVVTLVGGSTTATPNILCVDGANQDVCLQRQASGILNLTAGVAGTTFTRINFGTALSSNPALTSVSGGIRVQGADGVGASFIQAAEMQATARQITSGSGTGISVGVGGSLSHQIYEVTITSPAFICAALVCDVTIGTIPAKGWLLMVLGDLTTTFACTATCTTATLSMMLGRGAGGAEFLASGLDVDAAITQFGDIDAELGTQMTRAAAIQGGVLGAWAGTTTVVMRLTSGTGNIGTGAASNLSQGTIKFYLVTDVWP